MNISVIHGKVVGMYQDYDGSVELAIRTERNLNYEEGRRRAESVVNVRLYGKAAEMANKQITAGDWVAVTAHFDDNKIVGQWVGIMADLKERR